MQRCITSPCLLLYVLDWVGFLTLLSNGRWGDIRKRDSMDRRRAYPDMHSLFLESAEDAIKLLRNHPSLVMWVGGNEWPPPPDIDVRLEAMVADLDPSRLYMPSSLSRGIGDNGDGPYGMPALLSLLSSSLTVSQSFRTLGGSLHTTIVAHSTQRWVALVCPP